MAWSALEPHGWDHSEQELATILSENMYLHSWPLGMCMHKLRVVGSQLEQWWTENECPENQPGQEPRNAP